MQNLNDLYYFASVVDHGGFAPASRALGIPKSRLSRRVSALEGELGVRLLQRSTRRFAVTDVGMSVHRHAQSMLAEAQAAREVVDRLSAEPRGVVRVSVPVSMAQQQFPKLLPEFMALHPKVRLQLIVSNRRVDVINESVDVAIRVRSKLDEDGSLVMRSFGQIQELLVASPAYLDRAGRPSAPEELAEHVTLSVTEEDARQRWELQGPDGELRRFELQPRISGFDFPMMLALADDLERATGTMVPRLQALDRAGAGVLPGAPAARERLRHLAGTIRGIFDREAIEGARGQFQADCRGVGAAWEVAEVRRIATALMGTVDLIAHHHRG